MDITPSLIQGIRTDFQKRYSKSQIIRTIKPKIEDGTATYEDAYKYASEIGNLRAKTIKNQISEDKLPDGKMYYNIAERVTSSCLGDDYEKVQEICNVAQKNKNKALKIGLSTIEEEIDEEGIKNIANMISNQDEYDKYSKMFEIACATFSKTVVDRNMKANASFQNKIGLKIVIERIAGAGCCSWCSALAGSYEMGKAPDDVWSHHNGCTCSVDYDRK